MLVIPENAVDTVVAVREKRAPIDRAQPGGIAEDVRA
jgi:hypothetical protein